MSTRESKENSLKDPLLDGHMNGMKYSSLSEDPDVIALSVDTYYDSDDECFWDRPEAKADRWYRTKVNLVKTSTTSATAIEPVFSYFLLGGLMLAVSYWIAWMASEDPNTVFDDDYNGVANDIWAQCVEYVFAGTLAGIFNLPCDMGSVTPTTDAISLFAKKPKGLINPPETRPYANTKTGLKWLSVGLALVTFFVFGNSDSVPLKKIVADSLAAKIALLGIVGQITTTYYLMFYGKKLNNHSTRLVDYINELRGIKDVYELDMYDLPALPSAQKLEDKYANAYIFVQGKKTGEEPVAYYVNKKGKETLLVEQNPTQTDTHDSVAVTIRENKAPAETKLTRTQAIEQLKKYPGYSVSGPVVPPVYREQSVEEAAREKEVISQAVSTWLYRTVLGTSIYALLRNDYFKMKDEHEDVFGPLFWFTASASLWTWIFSRTLPVKDEILNAAYEALTPEELGAVKLPWSEKLINTFLALIQAAGIAVPAYIHGNSDSFTGGAITAGGLLGGLYLLQQKFIAEQSLSRRNAALKAKNTKAKVAENKTSTPETTSPSLSSSISSITGNSGVTESETLDDIAEAKKADTAALAKLRIAIDGAKTTKAVADAVQKYIRSSAALEKWVGRFNNGARVSRVVSFQGFATLLLNYLGIKPTPVDVVCITAVIGFPVARSDKAMFNENMMDALSYWTTRIILGADTAYKNSWWRALNVYWSTPIELPQKGAGLEHFKQRVRAHYDFPAPQAGNTDSQAHATQPVPVPSTTTSTSSSSSSLNGHGRTQLPGIAMTVVRGRADSKSQGAPGSFSLFASQPPHVVEPDEVVRMFAETKLSGRSVEKNAALALARTIRTEASFVANSEAVRAVAKGAETNSKLVMQSSLLQLVKTPKYHPMLETLKTWLLTQDLDTQDIIREAIGHVLNHRDLQGQLAPPVAAMNNNLTAWLAEPLPPAGPMPAAYDDNLGAALLK